MNKFPIFLLQFTFKCEPNAKHCDFSFFLTSFIIICISMYYIFTLDFSFFFLYTAWRLNQFVFENVTLREIVNQLCVKFNVNINLESTKLAQRKFRCVINEDESLPDILKLLKYLAPIQYRIEGKEIFIYE